MKDQKPNGKLLSFGSKGRIKNLITSEIHTTGLESVIDKENTKK